jgi:hypothetical protein
MLLHLLRSVPGEGDPHDRGRRRQQEEVGKCVPQVVHDETVLHLRGFEELGDGERAAAFSTVDEQPGRGRTCHSLPMKSRTAAGHDALACGRVGP